MESLPPTAYIAIGTLIAAFITGAVSLVNIVMSKEQKISELRQVWINDLRNEVSDLIANVNSLMIIWTTFSENYQGNTLGADFLKESKLTVKEIDSLSHKIRLRLNSNEHSEMIETISLIESQCGDLDYLESNDELSLSFDKLHQLTQDVLKTEWERVKAGEGGFKKLRNTFIGIFIVPVIIGSFWFLPFVATWITE